MSNEKREQQMMDAADRYADEVCDESCTGAQVADTINDFCAGWRAADSYPNWISVEEELPKERGQYFVYTAAGQSWQSEWMQDKSGEWYWFCSPMTVGTIANVTHWMEIVPPRKEDNK